MQKVKVGQIWKLGNYNYKVVGTDGEICAWTDPAAEPEKEGYVWSGPESEFRKLFSPKSK